MIVWRENLGWEGSARARQVYCERLEEIKKEVFEVFFWIVMNGNGRTAEEEKKDNEGELELGGRVGPSR